MRVLLTHWLFYVFGIFCCSISHSTSHAPIFYAKKMIARRLRRFFEVNLFYSLCSGREKAPPRRVGQRGEAPPVRSPLWFIAGPLMLASISSMPTRTQPSKKRAPFPRRALRATCWAIHNKDDARFVCVAGFTKIRGLDRFAHAFSSFSASET